MIKAIIIDDETHCIDTLSILLADYCPEVTIMEKCGSAKKGLEAIEKLNPDLVFLDIEMPVMDGFELLDNIRQRNTQIPAIAFTAALLAFLSACLKACLAAISKDNESESTSW